MTLSTRAFTKKFIAVFLSVSLVFALFVGVVRGFDLPAMSAGSHEVAQDGTYTTEATVYPDDPDDPDFLEYPLRVTVSVVDGKIDSFSAEGYGANYEEDESTNRKRTNNAVAGILEKLSGVEAKAVNVPENPAVGVDTVSKATCSSNAIYKALRKALLEAPAVTTSTTTTTTTTTTTKPTTTSTTSTTTTTTTTKPTTTSTTTTTTTTTKPTTTSTTTTTTTTTKPTTTSTTTTTTTTTKPTTTSTTTTTTTTTKPTTTSTTTTTTTTKPTTTSSTTTSTTSASPTIEVVPWDSDPVATQNGWVRLHKSASSTNTPAEYRAHLSIDVKQEVQQFFEMAKLVSQTNSSDTLGSIVTSLKGSDAGATFAPNSGNKKSTKVSRVVGPDGDVLATDLTLSWSTGNQITVYVPLSNGKYLVVGARIKDGGSAYEIKLGQAAYDALMETVLKTVNLNKVQDTLAPHLEFLGVDYADGTTAISGQTITWSPVLKEGVTSAESGWYDTVSELIYRVKLTDYESERLYPVSDTAVLNYESPEGNKTFDFPEPEVKAPKVTTPVTEPSTEPSTEPPTDPTESSTEPEKPDVPLSGRSNKARSVIVVTLTLLGTLAGGIFAYDHRRNLSE